MEDVILLDTSVVSVFLRMKKIHEARRAETEQLLTGKIALISFVTVAELLFWAEKRQWGEKRRDDLEQRLSAYGILDPTRTTADLWAETRYKCEAKGATVGAHDLWIAAAAQEHSIPVVTADGDFNAIPNITVVNI